MTVHGKILIQPPARGDMVYHNIADRVAPQRIIAATHIGLAPAKTHITDNHIMRVDPEGFPGYTDPVSGSRLPFDRDIGCANDNGTVDMDDTGDVEDHDTRTALFAGPAQRARSAIGQAV